LVQWTGESWAVNWCSEQVSLELLIGAVNRWVLSCFLNAVRVFESNLNSLTWTVFGGALYTLYAMQNENFTQQTQAPANRNARSKQWQPWLAACQRKRFRFLRFSFTQRKRLRLNGNRAWVDLHVILILSNYCCCWCCQSLLERHLVNCLLLVSHPELCAPLQTAFVSAASAHVNRDTSLLPAAVVSFYSLIMKV